MQFIPGNIKTHKASRITEKVKKGKESSKNNRILPMYHIKGCFLMHTFYSSNIDITRQNLDNGLGTLEELTFSFVELLTTSTSLGRALDVAKYSIAGS